MPEEGRVGMSGGVRPPSAGKVVRASLPLVLGVPLAVTALLVVYAVLPEPRGEASPWEVIVAATGVALLYVAAAAWSIGAIHRASHPMRTGTLLLIVMVTALVVVFSLVYVALSADDPGSFTEPLDKIDGLYFTMTVLSTVGFGDITAVSSTARIVVMVQMVVALTLITALARVLLEVARRETRRRSSG